MKPNALEIALAVLVVVVLVWVANWDPLGSKARLKARVASAEGQAVVSGATAQAVDAVAIKTQAVETRTHVIVRTIEAAPGADAPVPADVLRVWRDGLRDDPNSPPG